MSNQDARVRESDEALPDQETAEKPQPVPEPVPLPTRPSLALVAFLFILASAGLTLFHVDRSSNVSTNVMSRWATVEALVHHGTYAIDDTKYTGTIDKVRIGEKFYSSKPPLLPTVVAGVYWVVHTLSGQEIGVRGSPAAWVCKVATVFVWHVLLLIWFFRLAVLMLRRDQAILIALVAICFGFIGAGYATTLNNHSPAATVALMGFYYAYRVRHGIAVRRRHWLFAGLCAGTLPALDLPSLAISVGLFVYLLQVDFRNVLRLFVPAALPPLVLHLSITYGITGSVVPIYMRREFYEYPGSFWLNPRGIHALREPAFVYGFNLLLGHHGLFSMTPLFVLSLIALVGNLRLRSQRFAEALLISAIGVIFLVFYVVRTHNYGGICLGARWLVVYMPFLFLFLGVWLEQMRLRRSIWIVLVLLFLVSQFNALDALDNPWKEGRWNVWLRSMTQAS